MTLYRQLIIFTLCLFFLLFTGSWLAKFESTRSFLINQLQSHAQDTATSLGLTISTHVAADDMPTVEGMINAVFDRGYYESIILIDTANKPILERKLKVTIENVPQWFISLVPLKTPEATANIMSGWRQTGTIHIKSHPGYAYNTLWEDVLRMSLWFAACGILVLVGGAVGLRILLKPLFLVEEQANALCRKEYEIQEHLPWTKELRSVVQAMNRMTIKVREMFEEQVAHAESLRERAYHDVLTGLGNRRYFESQLNAYLDHPDSPKKGMILLLQIHDLSILNQKRGFQAGDELLQRVGGLIKECFAPYENGVLARLTGGDFCIFLPDALPFETEAISTLLTNQLRQIATEKISFSDNVGHIGISVFDGPVSLARLLSEADAALASAKQIGANAWSIRVMGAESEKMPLGQREWKELLEKSLYEGRIVLDAQPVVKTQERNHILHLEVFSRIVQENGELLSAALFMPFAERLKLVSALDRIVLEKIMKFDRHKLPSETIAVNISAASLQDLAFRKWLESLLVKLPSTAPRLIFEFTEYGAVQNLQLLREFSTFVRKCGHAIGLDHFGQSFSHLGYLQSLRPEYVKIDRAYTGELKEGENDSRFYIGSLCSVAHSIDIAVIAEGVETEQQYLILKEFNLDAVQGYVVERPKPMETFLK
jgi:diguanylate cyclase (GGDEF)-like protein